MSKNRFYAGWRWSDDQKVWWRFLWSRDARNTIGAVVEAHGGDYYVSDDALTGMRSNYRPYIRLTVPFVSTVMVALPRLLLRFVGSRVYGARYNISEGFFSLFYGRQSDYSSQDKSWHCHVPWQDKRMVRYRYFDIDRYMPIREFYDERGRIPFDPHYQFEQSSALPKRSYRLTDYDGETIYCTVHVKEMMWKHGTRWCRWMSWFIPNRIRTYVEMEFCPAYGRKKNTWKGGTIGHSIDLLAGERTDDAMRRYCTEHDMVFGEVLPAVYVPPQRPPANAETAQAKCEHPVHPA